MSFGFKMASSAAMVILAVATAIGIGPGAALAQEVTGLEEQNEPRVVIVPAVATTPPIVDQGMIDGTAEAAALLPEPVAPAASLRELVARHRSAETIDRQHECLAGAVYFESKGEPLDGQLAVAQVVVNRAESGRFPESLCGVVFQRGQFSFVRGGALPRIDRSSRAWADAVAIARVAIDDAWDSSVADALFFHASRVSPGWRRARVAQLGNHIFYR